MYPKPYSIYLRETIILNSNPVFSANSAGGPWEPRAQKWSRHDSHKEVPNSIGSTTIMKRVQGTVLGLLLKMDHLETSHNLCNFALVMTKINLSGLGDLGDR